MRSLWEETRDACITGNLSRLKDLVESNNLINPQRIREYEAKALVNQYLQGPVDLSRHMELLELAARQGQAQIVRYLLEIDRDFGMPVFVAAMGSKSVDTMQAFINANKGILRAIGPHRTTCLLEALYFEPETALVAIQVLLRNKYELNYQHSALQQAVYLSSPAVVEELERYRAEEADKAGKADKADVADGADGAGPSKLELIPKAAESGSQEMVAYLLDAGADINYAQPYTALYAAINNRDVEMVRFLLQRGADWTVPSFPGGPTALEFAQEASCLEVVELLTSGTW